LLKKEEEEDAQTAVDVMETLLKDVETKNEENIIIRNEEKVVIRNEKQVI